MACVSMCGGTVGGGERVREGGEALRGRSECVEKGRGGVEKFESCLPEGGGQAGGGGCMQEGEGAGRQDGGNE